MFNQLKIRNMKNKNLENYEKHLRRKEYAPNTIKTYSYYVGLFFDFTNKPPSHIFKKDAYLFIESCSDLHWIVKNQIISSLKLLYKYEYKTELDDVVTERPRKQKTLPRVYDHDVLINKFRNVNNLKHRAMLEIGYRCGLRVSEVCNLKVEDVDSDKMQIFIHNSKGNKDGYVPMSKELLKILRCYYKKYKPTTFLFKGQNGQYSQSSCQKIFKKYIDENGSWHKLRHSYGTTLVERNVSLRTIQGAMRHKSSKTTEIYTHISDKSLSRAAI